MRNLSPLFCLQNNAGSASGVTGPVRWVWKCQNPRNCNPMPITMSTWEVNVRQIANRTDCTNWEAVSGRRGKTRRDRPRDSVAASWSRLCQVSCRLRGTIIQLLNSKRRTIPPLASSLFAYLNREIDVSDRKKKMDDYTLREIGAYWCTRKKFFNVRLY